MKISACGLPDYDAVNREASFFEKIVKLLIYNLKSN
jgi:hypothetical protein